MKFEYYVSKSINYFLMTVCHPFLSEHLLLVTTILHICQGLVGVMVCKRLTCNCTVHCYGQHSQGDSNIKVTGMTLPLPILGLHWLFLMKCLVFHLKCIFWWIVNLKSNFKFCLYLLKMWLLIVHCGVYNRWMLIDTLPKYGHDIYPAMVVNFTFWRRVKMTTACNFVSLGKKMCEL